MRRPLILLTILGIILAVVAGWGYRNARADPVVRRAAFALPHWPAGAAPVTVVLLSDVHLGNVTMDANRLRRIVGQVAAQKPDLVLVAGDFVGGHDRADAKVAPALRAFGQLRPRLGVIAVPGNHDHWTNAKAISAVLTAAGVTVLANSAVKRGPLVIGGIDDEYTLHADVAVTLAAMAELSGAPVVLSHSPDVSPSLPPGAPLLLAGHTHCAQLYLPWLFTPRVPSQYGDRYRCGLIREGARAVVVTAGLGTSIVPFRFGAPPDVWLLKLGP